MIYLKNRNAEHPLWAYAAAFPKRVRVGVQLAYGRRYLTNREYARIALDELHEVYGADDMPIEAVDVDGRPVKV